MEKVRTGKYSEIFRTNGEYFKRATNPRRSSSTVVKGQKNGSSIFFPAAGFSSESTWEIAELEVLFAE